MHICYIAGEAEEMKIRVAEMKIEVDKAEEKVKAETERAEKAHAEKLAVELVQWGLEEKLEVRVRIQRL